MADDRDIMAENQDDRDIMALNQEFIANQVTSMFWSPTWIAPIAQFIDANCGIFEDVEENKFEYTFIHKAFKQLVEDLLEAHLSELSVTTEQFTTFCEHGLTGSNGLHRDLIEQLLSFEDFLVFKAMMVKRNCEIVRESIEIVKTMTAAPPQDFAPEVDPEAEQLERERLEAEKLAEMQLEAELLEAKRRHMEAELQLAMAISKQLKMKLALMEKLSETLETLAKMKEIEEALAAEAEQNDPDNTAVPETVHVQPLAAPAYGNVYLGAPAGTGEPEPLVFEQEAAIQRDRGERAIAASKQQAFIRAQELQARQMPSEEEKVARKEHLKRQRDALMAKKQQERQVQLNEFQRLNGPTNASRAAEMALEGKREDERKSLVAELSAPAPEAVPLPAPQQDTAAAEMRRMLMRQLKNTFV